MNLNRVLSLVLSVFISASFEGCIIRELVDARQLDSMAARANLWLGKSKDDRMKVIGPPDKCAALREGGEVCDWVLRAVSTDSVNCPPDLIYGGHQCRGGGSHSEEHHALFTYDRSGIATEWNYRGSLGQRSSRDSQAMQAMKEKEVVKDSKPVGDSLSQDDPRSSLGAPVGDKRDRASDNMSQTKIGTQEKASSVRRSPREIVLVGFPLEAEASRKQIQDAILNRGGKLLSRLHSPERDEFDSSSWIDGSQKTAAFYTQTGQFVGLVISWPVVDSQRGRAFVAQLEAQLTKDFGPTTRDDIGQGGRPLLHQWETAPVSAAIIAEWTDSPNVFAMFMLPDRLTVLNSELGTSNSSLY